MFKAGIKEITLAYEVTTCRGFEPNRCRFAMPLPDDIQSLHATQTIFAEDRGNAHDRATEQGNAMANAIYATLAASPWNAFIHERLKGDLRHHHVFKVAMSACPNGCSRPHVADMAIVRAIVPSRPSEACTACGLCIRQCPDGALSPAQEGALLGHGHAVRRGMPMLDVNRCMACGLCVRRCPERALAPEQNGWRILLGGCLGRHPRLATALEGIHDSQTVCRVLERALVWYMQDYDPRRRFARLVEEDTGHGAFLLC